MRTGSKIPISTNTSTELADLLARFRIDHIREAESFHHATEIQRDFGKLDQVLNWCKIELVGDWRWQMTNSANMLQPGRYIFYFDSERDYLAFTLKWVG